MHKLKLYMDTSVFNFTLTNRPELVLQKRATLDLLEVIKQGEYEAFVSEVVIAEIDRAPQDIAIKLKELVKEIAPEELTLTADAEDLAEKYISQEIIPDKYENDVFHIAIASVN